MKWLLIILKEIKTKQTGLYYQHDISPQLNISFYILPTNNFANRERGGANISGCTYAYQPKSPPTTNTNKTPVPTFSCP